MDGGPRRAQSRSVINRGRTEASELETAAPETAAPRPAAVPSRSYHHTEPEPGFFKKNLWALIVIFVLICVMIGGFFAMKGSEDTAIDSNKYQAVFFTNGQVYFGKLHTLNSGSMSLTDVYYLQSGEAAEGDNSSENPQNTSSDKKNMQLVKLGKEIHGPEDEMIISKDQVLFYENLKSDGKVAESIAKYSENK